MIKPGELFTFTVAESDSGGRLDTVVATASQCSRTLIQEFIKRGVVTVDGKIAKKSSILVGVGQHIILSVPRLCSIELGKTDSESILDRVVLCAEEDDFIIINKPAGLVVHAPNRKTYEPSLVDWLALKGFLHGFDGSDVRPGIVHRLDKDTSGIMIIAKNRLAHAAFADFFRLRKMRKKYYALVGGNFPEKIRVDSFLIRDPISHIKMASVPYSYHENGKSMTSSFKRAISDIKKIKQLLDYAFVEVVPITGRTHQIRVHCASIGHPVIGDWVYGEKSKHIARHALHAFSLAFEYKGRDYSYEVPIPQDMAAMID